MPVRFFRGVILLLSQLSLLTLSTENTFIFPSLIKGARDNKLKPLIFQVVRGSRRNQQQRKLHDNQATMGMSLFKEGCSSYLSVHV